MANRTWTNPNPTKSWFGRDSVESLRKLGWDTDKIKNWASGAKQVSGYKSFADSGLKQIGRGVAEDLWGFTDPGDSDSFGKKDIDQLWANTGSKDVINRVMAGYQHRGKPVGQVASGGDYIRGLGIKEDEPSGEVWGNVEDDVVKWGGLTAAEVDSMINKGISGIKMPEPPPKMTTMGIADIGAGSSALGVRGAAGENSKLNIGSTGDVFGRRKGKKDKKQTTNLLPTSGITV